MGKLRILLVDDHAIVREGLTLLINAQPDMEVVGHASDGAMAVQLVLECRPDLVVMDASMPGVDGIHATEQIRQTDPEIQVIALTRHNEPGYVRQLLQAGTRGYILKQADTAELLNAVRTVAKGGTYLDSTLSKYVVHQFVNTQGSDPATPGLSQREIDVVRLIAYGYSNKEVAMQLGLSVKTIDTYRARAMEKLGLYSRAALVRYALQQGWLDQT